MGQSNSKSGFQGQVQGRWEWKSNPNPFSKTEQAQWTPYNLVDNYLLEQAFYNQRKEIDLGDYIISIKDMLQKRKDHAYRQRPIRRNTEPLKNAEKVVNQEENIRAKRFFGAETPKTYNQAFGNLEDYLQFFRNRGPDIKQFATSLNDIEIADNIDLLNQLIQPCLINCLQNESKKMPESFTKEQFEKQLLQLFQGTVESIQQFYANVLKAYTMEGFLYRNLNNYLRNEDWVKLDSLLPYTYCLCKAFLRQEFTSNLNNPQQLASMVVYRGAQFDETTLSFYDLSIAKNFCWNGVTSTSRNRQVSENFMFYNFDPKKVPVLFIIEVPLSLENTSTWIDIKPYSAIPNEDEVVLPPGSVFELISVSRNDKSTVEIYLKLMVDVKQLAHQGQIMHGAINSEMGSDTSLKLVCLEGREVSNAIAHLKGNRLIEELEFCLCNFDHNVVTVSFEKIQKLKSLSFISSSAGDETYWSVMLKHLEKTSIEKLKISDSAFNNNLLKNSSQRISPLTSLKSLILSLSRCYYITDEGLKQLSSQGLKYLTSLTSLTLDFEGCNQITDEGLKNLSSLGLKHLTSLTSLALNFSSSERITDKGLNSLASQGFKYLTSLTSLTLNFEKCSEITDKGLNHLTSGGLKYLASLTSLSLNFSHSEKITDNGLKNLSLQGLIYLTSLTSLTLHFGACSQITNEGLKNLSCEGLKYLNSLTSLTLHFNCCKKITDEGLNQLGPQGLKYLTSLTLLTLDFYSCDKITDEGLKDLSYQGLKYLTSLSSLTLIFAFCNEITDEGLSQLGFQGLKYLTSLISLTLHFYTCNEVTDEGLKNLSAQGLKYLTSITSLALDFYGCSKITDEGLNNLSCEGLEYLNSLSSLTLQFSSCKGITDQGLKNLSYQGFKHLTSLTSLTLRFYSCHEITDEVLKNLSSHGFKHLTSLTCLTLDFTCCQKITDGGKKYIENFRNLYRSASTEDDQSVGLTSFVRELNHKQSDLKEMILGEDAMTPANTLEINRFTENSQKVSPARQNVLMKKDQLSIIEAISFLDKERVQFATSLLCLTLEFRNCSEITDEVLKNLSSQGLKNLTSLTTLNLNCGLCKQITDEGLKNLSSEGLKYLTSLTSLTLDFYRCDKITNEGLKNLSSEGLKYLTSLSSLTLTFGFCDEITDEGLNYLGSNGLKYLASLKSLNLHFGMCSKITDEGLKNLSHQGLKYPTSVTSLALNFKWCSEITDEGLDQLTSQGLKGLTSLTSLALDFSSSEKITDEGYKNLKHLTSLTSLNPLNDFHPIYGMRSQQNLHSIYGTFAHSKLWSKLSPFSPRTQNANPKFGYHLLIWFQICLIII